MRAPGEHTNPIDRAGLIDKFHTLTAPLLAEDRRKQIEDAVFALSTPGAKLSDLSELLYAPVD